MLFTLRARERLLAERLDMALNKTKRDVIIFIAVVLASGWLGALLDMALAEQPDGNSLGMGLWLVLPFFASIALRLISRDGKNTGIKPNFKGNVKWYSLSAVAYLSVTAITIGFAAALGSVDISGFETRAFFPLIAVSVGGGLIKNIFEEFAWRGYLTPKLIELKLNDWSLYATVGLVWALWHAAYYLVFLPDIHFQSMPRAAFLLITCLIVPCWTVMYVEIYQLTGSVWPCVLMHTVEDVFPTLLVAGGFIAFTKSGDIWWNPTTGIVATALFLGIGLLLRHARKGRALATACIRNGLCPQQHTLATARTEQPVAQNCPHLTRTTDED